MTPGPSSVTAPATRRLFFALWPDTSARAAVRAAFGAAVAASGGRAVPDANLHMTLEFLGAVAAPAAAALGEIGAGLAGEAQDVVLDELQHWPRARTLVAAPSAPPPGLLALQAALRTRLAAGGFRVEARPYRPHVTLARHVLSAPARGATAPVSWPARTVALVESASAPGGSRYTPLACWALDGARKLDE